MTGEHVDVVVAGTGLVGTAVALLYANAGYQVLLTDERPALRAVDATAPDDLNLRTVALACRSVQLMREAGIWKLDEYCPIRAIHVSDRGRFGALRLQAKEFNLPALGYVVSNQVLERQLLGSAARHDNIRLEYSWSLSRLAQTQDGVDVVGAGDPVRCRLLIAADGTDSRLRQTLGINATRYRYQQSAIVGNIRSARGHDGEAFERFTEFGPLALLPVGDDQLAMVLTLPDGEVDRVMAMADAEFLRFVQSLFGGRLGRLQQVGRRHALELELVESRQQVLGRCVLLGNAARTVHPVAGQGLNLALRDAFQLAGSCAGTPDPGASAVLQHFAARRRADQRRVVRQTDVLARVFRRQPTGLNAVLGLLKSSSMLTLDLIPGLRRGFAAVNAGLGVPLDTSASSQND